MALNAVPIAPGAVFLFLLRVILFVVGIFLKLCYSTALFATLAEINRRITLFRQSRRPAQRTLLLLAAVVVFCSGVLFFLSFFRVVFGGVGFSLKNIVQPMEILWVFLRVGFLLVAMAAGGAVGIMAGRGVALGRDRFGGILTQNRGRYLGFWLFAFTLCGLFRILPWGFATYWAIWLLVLAACMVAAAHWTLYGACRAALAAKVTGLTPGEALDLSLEAPQALALSVLVRATGPLSPESLGRFLGAQDPAWMAHPAWAAQTQALRADSASCAAALEGLRERGLAAQTRDGWILSGGARRLAAMGFVEEAAGLTVRRGGRARTVVLQRRGPTALLVEPGPETLSIRELPLGSEGAAALADAVR
jgi:hypothetical protein